MGGARETLPLLASIFREIVRIGKERSIDTFCVTVNPRHAAFYDEIGFVTIGKKKEHPMLCGAPAVPKALRRKDATLAPGSLIGFLLNDK